MRVFKVLKTNDLKFLIEIFVRPKPSKSFKSRLNHSEILSTQ